MKPKRPLYCFLPALLALMLPVSAYAYVDPGTGSVLTTAILGLFAAVAYTFRKYMYRIKDMFSGRKPSPRDDQDRNARP